MARFNFDPATASIGEVDLKPVRSGGTGVRTLAEIPAAMNFLAVSDIGIPNGATPLDDAGKIPAALFPTNAANRPLQLGSDGFVPATSFKTNVASEMVKLDSNGKLSVGLIPGFGVTVTGPSTVACNITTVYTITNYNTATVYTVTAVSGSVRRTGDTITYTPPSTPGACGFIINGKQYNLTALTPYVTTPTITSPVDGFSLAVSAPTITSSAFVAVNTTDTHLSSDWELATDVGFTNIVQSSYSNTTNKTNWKVTGLSVNTTYYARVKHTGTILGASAYSAVVTFTTKAIFVPGAEQAILLQSDPTGSGWFGNAVSLSADGNTAVIGANQKSGTYTQQGAAYVFTRSGTTWTQEAKLTHSDPATGDWFGFSVSLSDDGNTVVIGAYFKTKSGASGAGAAYIFTRSGTTWTQEAKLTGGGASNAYFGYSVSLSANGSVVSIGAYGDNTYGAVYIFTRSGTTWTQQAKLTNNDPATRDYFGYSVSLSADGNTAVIGAQNKNGTYTQQGAAYVFTRSGTTWTQEAKLEHSDPAVGDWFGNYVSLSGDGNTAVIGAYRKFGTYNSQGAAYVFTRSVTTWTQEAKLMQSDPAVNDYFGQSVSISSDGNRVVSSTYRKTGTYINQGAVYIFMRSGTIWSQQAKLVQNAPAAEDYFGSSVSLSDDGNTLIAGASSKAVSGLGACGAAYIFS